MGSGISAVRNYVYLQVESMFIRYTPAFLRLVKLRVQDPDKFCDNSLFRFAEGPSLVIAHGLTTPFILGLYSGIEKIFLYIFLSGFILSIIIIDRDVFARFSITFVPIHLQNPRILKVRYRGDLSINFLVFFSGGLFIIFARNISKFFAEYFFVHEIIIYISIYYVLLCSQVFLYIIYMLPFVKGREEYNWENVGFYLFNISILFVVMCILYYSLYFIMQSFFFERDDAIFVVFDFLTTIFGVTISIFTIFIATSFVLISKGFDF